MSTNSRKGKTLAALERAAMRTYRRAQKLTWNVTSTKTPGCTNIIVSAPLFQFDDLLRACAAHAASKKRKGRK